MALPNDGFLVNPSGSGATLATHLVGGKEYPVLMAADESGHLVQSLPTYIFYIKDISVAAGNTDHWGIFNAAGSGKVLEMRGLWTMRHMAVAVAGTVSVDMDFYRTSAVHTGGTLLGYKSATFPNVSPMNTNNANPPAQVTVRSLPTAGGTVAENLFTSYITQEETQQGAQLGQWFNMLPDTTMGQRYTAREGQGFKLRQITLGVSARYSHFGLFTLV